jgi:NADPH-dependent 2,4-dienoyl-CoA reductase/sulfur reductase-like enzyme
MPGIDLDTVFSIRNIPDTDRIKAYIDDHSPESAVIVGGGYIGLEMAENLVERGVKTTIIEMLDQVMAPLDYEMAAMVQDHIKDKGVVLELENSATAFTRKGQRTVVSTGRGRDIECDLVILSIGIKPETQLARTANLEIGTIEGAVNIPVDDLRQNIDKLDKEKASVLCCVVGQQAYIGHRILKQKGFQSSNQSGGSATDSSVKEKIKPGN